MNTKQAKLLFSALTVAFALSPINANANSLSAATGGTFTFNYDSAALGLAAGGSASFNGYYVSNYWNTADSDPTNPTNTSSHFMDSAGAAQISAINLVHDITSAGPNPSNQATGRHVQGTSPTFSIDSDTLAGVSGTQLGLTGIHSFYAPVFDGNVTAGDFSLAYNDSTSGWSIKNNFSFGLNMYDLSNLALTVTDANNWGLTGNLLLAAGNAGMIGGQTGANVGTFNLGVGSYAASPVPVPAAAWLFGGGLLSLLGAMRKKSVVAA